ncbi:MAG TPA: MTH938/NDUFAF3 family protein [Dehalococcoidales bacterium]|nr:MTH938/NDUFAF3 family protein [Dehalococcoidales bacterium]
MAKIEAFNFGFIVIDEKQYNHDVVILPDGIIKDRSPGKGRLGSHSITRGEIESLVQLKPDIILVGTGVEGMARLARDAERYVFEPDCNLTLLPSAEIVKKFNQHVQDGEKVAALIHITC